MGLAMALMVFSLLCTFVMDFVVHFMKTEDANCMFRLFHSWNNAIASVVIHSFPEEPLYQNVYFFTFQSLLSALVNMLLDVAVYEFICAQSPYSMREESASPQGAFSKDWPSFQWFPLGSGESQCYAVGVAST